MQCPTTGTAPRCGAPPAEGVAVGCRVGGERAQQALRGCKERRCSCWIFRGGGLAFRRGAECSSNLTSVPFLHKGYGKSRSLNSIDGVAGPAGGLAPLASRYSSPCSPVPSIL